MIYRKLIICFSIIVLCGIGDSIYFWHDATRSKENVDPVDAAWAHLNYISENLHEWGEFSPRADELIKQLTPMWEISEEPVADEARKLLEELANLQDPRSAEVFVEYLFKSVIWGRSMEKALVAIGPPSVPILIPYLDNTDITLAKAQSAILLGIIGAKHRQELGGAVEHIIIPKLEKIAASEGSSFDKREASAALTRLQKNGE